jgi:hypothetical protein
MLQQQGQSAGCYKHDTPPANQNNPKDVDSQTASAHPLIPLATSAYEMHHRAETGTPDI